MEKSKMTPLCYNKTSKRCAEHRKTNEHLLECFMNDNGFVALLTVKTSPHSMYDSEEQSLNMLS